MRRLKKRHEEKNRIVDIQTSKSKVFKILFSNGNFEYYITEYECTAEELHFSEVVLPINFVVIDVNAPILSGDVVCDTNKNNNKGIFIINILEDREIVEDLLDNCFKVVASYHQLKDYYGNLIPRIPHYEIESFTDFNNVDIHLSIDIIKSKTEKLIVNQNLNEL